MKPHGMNAPKRSPDRTVDTSRTANEYRATSYLGSYLGSRSVKRVWSSFETTAIEPPCRSAISLTI